jgi:hypothetical protein
MAATARLVGQQAARTATAHRAARVSTRHAKRSERHDVRALIAAEIAELGLVTTR